MVEVGPDGLEAPVWAGDFGVQHDDLLEVSENSAVNAPIEEGALSGHRL